MKVKLDSQKTGSNVVLLKNGTRICGTGGAMSNAPLVQNKSFFQINVQQTGIWGVGVANKNANMQQIPVSKNAWVLRNDGSFMADGEFVGKIEIPVAEGETIGVSFDHVELKFYLNNTELSTSMSNVRGPVYPVLYVDDNAILDVCFQDFFIPIPGYEEIMFEQTLL